MTALSLSFGVPQHGWLVVRLACETRVRELEVSDVPGDSLLMLATALLDLLEGRATEAEVTWFLEPLEESWHFRRDGETFSLHVREAGSRQEPRRFARGTLAEVIAPMCRALRRLATEEEWSLETAWSQAFPAAEVAILAERCGVER